MDLRCRGSFIGGACARGSKASPELQNGYCKRCWNKEQRAFAEALLATNGQNVPKDISNCRNPSCGRGCAASAELHNGFCHLCWARYQREYELAAQAARVAIITAAGKAQQGAGRGTKHDEYPGRTANVAGSGQACGHSVQRQATAHCDNHGVCAAVVDSRQQSPAAAMQAAIGSGPLNLHKSRLDAARVAGCVQRPASAPRPTTIDRIAPPLRAQTPPPTVKATAVATAVAAGAAAAQARGNGPAGNTRAGAKDKIPTAVRNQVWLKYMGNAAFGICPCCGVNDISLVRSGGFECGHVQAEAKGGTTHLGNLIPVCKSCNLGMGTTNLFDYVRQFYPNRYQLLQAHHTAVVTSLMSQLRL